MQAKQYIDMLIEYTKKEADNIHLALVANVDGITTDFNDYPEHSVTTEFLTVTELEQLISASQKYGIYTTVFNDSITFIKNTPVQHINKINVLFETTQKGIGRGKDSLLPAYCELVHYIYTGPNAFVNSLTSNKYCWTKYLESHGIPVPKSWRYDELGWLFDVTPPANVQLICKPLYECASIGIDSRSVGYLNQEFISILDHKVNTYRQPFIVQELISGYEVEVPVICVEGNPIILPPISLSVNQKCDLNDFIFAFDDIYEDSYTFYPFHDINHQFCLTVEQIALKVAKLIEVVGYIRIDFRVTNLGECFVTDINAYPHIVEHSSFAQSFRQLGYHENDILPALIGNALLSFSNQSSSVNL